jgi:hypothetical protein
VIDVHQDWSGSCADVVEPFFKKLSAETDNRVKFLTANRPFFDAKLKSLFPSTAATSSSSSTKQAVAHAADGGGGGGGGPLTDGCTPLFLLVKNRVVVGTVAGVNIGMIGTCVKQHLSMK